MVLVLKDHCILILALCSRVRVTEKLSWLFWASCLQLRSTRIWAFVHQPSYVSYSVAVILCTYVDDVPQQIMAREQLLSCFMWVLGLKLKLSGLCSSTYTCWPTGASRFARLAGRGALGSSCLLPSHWHLSSCKLQIPKSPSNTLTIMFATVHK